MQESLKKHLNNLIQKYPDLTTEEFIRKYFLIKKETVRSLAEQHIESLDSVIPISKAAKDKITNIFD